MRRRRWFRLRLVALGLAVAAFTAPAAQAIPAGLDGSELRAIQSVGSELVVSPDDRSAHGTSPPITRSPDDRPLHGPTGVEPATQPVSAGDDGFELSHTVLGGIVLALLAAVTAGYAAYQIRRAGKTARA